MHVISFFLWHDEVNVDDEAGLEKSDWWSGVVLSLFSNSASLVDIVSALPPSDEKGSGCHGCGSEEKRVLVCIQKEVKTGLATTRTYLHINISFLEVFDSLPLALHVSWPPAYLSFTCHLCGQISWI